VVLKTPEEGDDERHTAGGRMAALLHSLHMLDELAELGGGVLVVGRNLQGAGEEPGHRFGILGRAQGELVDEHEPEAVEGFIARSSAPGLQVGLETSQVRRPVEAVEDGKCLWSPLRPVRIGGSPFGLRLFVRRKGRLNPGELAPAAFRLVHGSPTGPAGPRLRSGCRMHSRTEPAT
jgi:hypothetical protein